MSNVFKKSCPYNCGSSQEVEAKEGFQLLTCENCAKPGVVETTYTPFLQSRMVEGFGIQLDTTDLGYIHCADCGNAISPDSQFRLCAECLDSPDPLPVNKPREGHYWPSEKDVLICAHCRKGYEDHGITDGVCPTCFLDEDSVKGIKINEPRSEFKPLITNTKVLYRCDPEYVDIKYCQNAHVRTSWADIYSIIEEVEEDRRPIIASLLGAEGNKPKVTGVNVFVHAVEQGCVPEAPSQSSGV